MRIYLAGVITLLIAAMVASTLSLVSLSQNTRTTHTASYRSDLLTK